MVDWNAAVGRAIGAACLVPGRDDLLEAHIYAGVQASVHDALNGIEQRFTRVAYRGFAPKADPDVAVAAASRTVLVEVLRDLPRAPQRCIDTARASVETDYARAVSSAPESAAKTAGIFIGTSAARAVLADGGWVAPSFGLGSAALTSTPPPYRVSSAEYTRDFEEVRTLGGDGVTTGSARTQDQTNTVLFWRQTAPKVWNSIARNAALAQDLDDWETARLLGLLNMALADAADTSATTPLTPIYSSPKTAIRSADTDGNRETRSDPSWTPLDSSAGTSESDSARALSAGAAAAVMRAFFGDDTMTFSACDLSMEKSVGCGRRMEPLPRTYESFSQAANESGWSEILSGSHFRRAVRSGLDRGTLIGDAVSNRQLTPDEPVTSGLAGCSARNHQPRQLGLRC